MQRRVRHTRTYEHHLHEQLLKYAYIIYIMHGVDNKLMLPYLLIPFLPTISLPCELDG